MPYHRVRVCVRVRVRVSVRLCTTHFSDTRTTKESTDLDEANRSIQDTLCGTMRGVDGEFSHA